MDLRSTKPGLRAALGTGLFHPTKRHPHTGLPLEAVGVGKDGTPWWPVMGGSEDDAGDGGDGDGDDSDDDDEDDDDSDDADDADDNDGDDDSDDDDDKGKKKGKKKSDPAARVKALEEEKDRHYKKAKKAERENAELKARIQKLEEAGMKPEDIAKRRQEEADAEKARADQSTQALRLENAFLRANTIDWVKPSQALAILMADDDYEVEFDADGTVDRKSLTTALKRLAKANPHLVRKPKSQRDDDDKDQDDKGTPGTGRAGSTAPTMNGKRKGKKDGKSREELAKKFPVLNRLSR